jgi:hypothetical protein
MPGEPSGSAKVAPGGWRIGSWLGAALSAVGLGASIAVVTLGGMATMDQGGYVASGGPYQIAHPVPEGFWILPVAFIGLWVFPIAHSIFASRIKGFGLIFATWCAVWTLIGGTTFWYGLNPPSGDGLVWGWLMMGGIFLLVGLGSTWLYLSYLRSPDREHSQMPAKQRLPYAALIAVALAGGVVAGFQAFSALVS